MKAKTTEDCETVHVYMCWFKTAARNVCKGCMSRCEGFVLVTVGNEVSSLIKKGDFVSCFFAELFNWQLQCQVYSAPFSDYLQQPQEKIHYLLYNGFPNIQIWNQCFSQIPLCCNTSMTWQKKRFWNLMMTRS